MDRSIQRSVDLFQSGTRGTCRCSRRTCWLVVVFVVDKYYLRCKNYVSVNFKKIIEKSWDLCTLLEMINRIAAGIGNQVFQPVWLAEIEEVEEKISAVTFLRVLNVKKNYPSPLVRTTLSNPCYHVFLWDYNFFTLMFSVLLPNLLPWHSRDSSLCA